jgi:hypothetical protein
MQITPLSPDAIVDLAALNFDQVYKAWRNQEELVFTYINGNVIRNPTIRMFYHPNEEHKEYEYYCTNLPGCVISESDGEEAFNKMIWGVIECLDCRYSLNKINSRIHLTGQVFHFKSYKCDLTHSTFETVCL